MSIKEISKYLCYYDLRNPDSIESDASDDSIKELGYTTKSKENCYCDNCFYGRTKLAEEIVKLRCPV